MYVKVSTNPICPHFCNNFTVFTTIVARDHAIEETLNFYELAITIIYEKL